MCVFFVQKNKSQNKCKKASAIFDPSQRYPNSGNLSQNPKVCENNIDFSNRAKTFTTPYDLVVNSPLSKFFPNQCKTNIFSVPFFLESLGLLRNCHQAI